MEPPSKSSPSSASAESSKVWKNLLSGKQAVPTVACPSCGSQVPEFRIHSHLDTCLIVLSPSLEAGSGVNVGEGQALSDGGGDQIRKGRVLGGRGLGRGLGGRVKKLGVQRKRGGAKDGDGDMQIEGADGGRGVLEGGRKQRRYVITSGGDAAVEENSTVYVESLGLQGEYSVTGMHRLGKLRQEMGLNEVEKQELSAVGVLTIESQEVGTMILQLDRLLADFQATEGTTNNPSLSSSLVSRVHTANAFRVPELSRGSVANLNDAAANRRASAQSDEQDALESWWGQWATGEWPEGPLPSGFHAGLPQRSEARSGVPQRVDTDTQKVPIKTSAAVEISNTSSHQITTMSSKSAETFDQKGGVVKGQIRDMPLGNSCADQPLTEFDRNQEVGIGLQTETKTFSADRAISNVTAGDEADARVSSKEVPTASEATKLGINSNVEPARVARFVATRARPLSPSTDHLAEISGTSSSGILEGCPICGFSFPPSADNRSINVHIDECLNLVAELLD